MKETHPFGDFVPPRAQYLILGGFTGRQAVKGHAAHEERYDWFYGTRRNQFWRIIEEVYSRELPDTRSRKALLAELGIAMADIIKECERKEDNNLDASLINIVYNTEGIASILRRRRISAIFFSSRFVERKFVRAFKETVAPYPGITYATLPSPSPRYAQMTKEQKVQRYKELLPRISRTR